MYHALLTRRYLTSKIMPLLASLAVMLCTGMVVVVWSVMGGFLTHLIGSGRTLVGDAQIEVPGAGFAHYEELQKRLAALPEVEATAPAIVTQAMLVLPGSRGRRDLVLVRGIEGESFARVSGYSDAMWWKPLAEPMRKDAKKEDPRLDPERRAMYEDMRKNGARLGVPAEDGGGVEAAAVLGIEVTGNNRRHPEGFYTPWGRHGYPRFKDGSMGSAPWLLENGNRVSLHVLPVDRGGEVMQTETRRLDLPVANEFQSGVYEIDRKTVLVRLDALQRALLMDKAVRTSKVPAPGTVVRNPDGSESFAEPQVLGEEPARVTTVYVRARGDVTDLTRLEAFKEALRAVVDKFQADYPDAGGRWLLGVSTWRDQNITFISAVEKELGLTVFLFAFISIVAVFLVLAIFWSMVAEKTKDVGILRAIGASRSGVAWVWVRYGLVIGVVGSLGGGVLSYAIVTNINEIHDWLGRVLHITVWDPKVYYFSEIPAQFKWLDAGVVLAAGVLSSGIGAFVPAMRAARMDPVRSLRFE